MPIRIQSVPAPHAHATLVLPRFRPPHPSTTRGLWRSLILHSAWLAALLALTACGSDLPVTTRSAAYTGPAVAIDSGGRTHTVVIQAPTPGHTVTLDAVRDRLNGREALITIREPDPRYLVPQMIVEQRVGTGVPTDTPLDVFIRVLPRDSRENTAYPYVTTSSQP